MVLALQEPPPATPSLESSTASEGPRPAVAWLFLAWAKSRSPPRSGSRSPGIHGEPASDVVLAESTPGTD